MNLLTYKIGIAAGGGKAYGVYLIAIIAIICIGLHMHRRSVLRRACMM